jgi:hypothetical protein
LIEFYGVLDEADVGHIPRERREFPEPVVRDTIVSQEISR